MEGRLFKEHSPRKEEKDERYRAKQNNSMFDLRMFTSPLAPNLKSHNNLQVVLDFLVPL